MGRNSVENQRRYRERKKAQDPEYLAKEVQRVQKYYTPTSDLSPTIAKQRREKGRLSMQRTRAKRKQEIDENIDTHVQFEKVRRSKRLKLEEPDHLQQTLPAQPHTGTTGQTVETQEADTDPPTRLTVKFPWRNKRRRVSRAVSLIKRQYTNSKDANRKLQRKIWSLQKRLDRQQTKKCSSSAVNNPQFPTCTPIKKADNLLRTSGISPRRAMKVRKTLILHNSMLKQLADSDKNVCKKLIMSPYVKCTNSSRFLARSLNISRKVHAKRLQTRKAMRSAIRRRAVIIFLKREDNSTCLPGKRDAVKIGKVKVQKYILNENIDTLHKKYNLENPLAKVSRSFFFNARPKYIIPIIYANRKVCLCQRHQNFALKLQALKPEGFLQNPDKFAKDTTFEEAEAKLKAIQLDEITYRVWRQIERPYKESTIKKTTLTEDTKTKKEFIQEFLNSLKEFKEHAHRVEQQYQQITQLKETLLPSEVTVQVDFAENYVCHFAEEVSSAYYSKQQITIHPAVIHYKIAPSSSQQENVSLQHKSVVLVSDESSHTASTVFAFLKEITAWIKESLGNITRIHYISDSPTSQYRNCHIFKIVSLHKQMFGIDATWQYWESGHGKGPCDGVGGSVKRGADLAVKKGRLIQTALDFYEWGTANKSSNVSYILVEKNQIAEAAAELKLLADVPIPGTMKIHSVVAVGDTLYLRDISCFRQCCWKDGDFNPTCNGWIRKVQRTVAETSDRTTVEITETAQMETDAPEDHGEQPADACKPDALITDVPFLNVGNYAAVRYNNQVYLGRVLEYDPEDNDYFITFMEETRTVFHWPSKKDELWVAAGDIIKKITNLTPTGRSQRTFKLSEEEAKGIFF